MDADIGILGTGRMGLRLARMFADAGRNVVLGSRDPDRAAQAARQLQRARVVPGSYQQALAAPAVLPAIFVRDGLLDLLRAQADALRGKLVIDISNPYNDDYSDFLTGWDTSASEELRKVLPEARIVGAYKNVFWGVLDDPLFLGTPSDVLVVGDDAEAKAAFFALSAGTPFRYLDAGPLINARTVERMTLITGALGRSIGAYPRMNWRLLG